MTDDKTLSRRDLFRGAAIASGGTVLAACGGTPATTGPNPDIIPLNLLLTDEYNLIGAYGVALTNLANPPAGDPEAMYALTVAAILTQWKAQHTNHAAVLAAAITSLHGTPVTQASVGTYTPPAGYSPPSVGNTLSLISNLEKATAVAYASAVAQLTEASNRFIAGTIEGDETQHFIVLFALVNGLVSPGVALAAMGTASIVADTYVVAPPGGMGTDLVAIANFTYT